MRRSGKPQSARHGLQTKFAKKAANIAGYVLASAIVAMAMAYWPASAGDILVRLNLVPGRLAAAAVPDRTRKSDRLAISFEQRWSAVTTRATEVRDSKSG